MNWWHWNWATIVAAVCGVIAIGLVLYGILMRHKWLTKDNENDGTEAFLSFIGAVVLAVITTGFLLFGLLAVQ